MHSPRARRKAEERYFMYSSGCRGGCVHGIGQSLLAMSLVLVLVGEVVTESIGADIWSIGGEGLSPPSA